MTRLVRILASCPLLISLAARLHGSQILIPVNTDASTLRVDLCVTPPSLSQRCDDEIHSLTGFLVIALNDNRVPTQVALRNFDVQATADYNLAISYGLLGNISAVARSLRIFHAQPGPTNSFVPVNAGQFAFQDVPVLTSGTADYNITGLACVALGGSFPCSSNIDLSTLGENSVTNIPGTLQVSNGIVHVFLDLVFTTPLSQDSPELGTLTGHAIIHGAALLPTDLVPAGSDWKYLDDGSDPGSGWKDPAFTDDAWKLGVAQLGYGDGDEATVVGFGSDPTNKFITTYFRHSFQVSDPTAYPSLTLRLLRDDGAVVYLNGTEVFRTNMPSGAITPLTLALAAVGGADETNYLSTWIEAALLRSGLNVLAVEIHQNSGGSTDISFDLNLATPPLTAPPVVALLNPAAGDTFAAGRTVQIRAQATDADSPIAKVQFFADTNKIGEVSVAPYDFAWVNPPSGLHSLSARAIDTSGAVGVSAPVAINSGTFTMIRSGSDWKYSDTGADLGVVWRQFTYNDSAWDEGPAQLGYGDNDEATLIDGGPTTNRFMTAYFRHKWIVLDRTLISRLTLRLLRDDGAVVYLNGMEVHRSNLPAGTVTNGTPALAAVADADETNYVTASVPATILRNGTNALAVEVHQSSPTSSDLSFDLQLLAATLSASPRLSVQVNGATLELRWPASAVAYRLQQAASLLPNTGWLDVTGVPVEDGVWKTLQLSNGPHASFYRLIAD
jgi:hypothetical protein